ncbi:TetR/AcrR family transcriptional regulator [Oceanobacillus sp. 1P07AA]|uniref:TetR/AcrR family transcriptional regulator n=1 Tax=Oceanobacillus sp. 1P07AA TaxID=3132293 RepID=UPI0039A51307
MNHKKKQIIDAAQSLFIKKGFTSTSIQDILDVASISKGTFYNYFTSKNECLIELLQLIREEVVYERKHLAASKEASDKSVFIKQIAVRFHIDKKHNLLALFSSLPTSSTEDDELHMYIKTQYLQEIVWIAERLTSIYGDFIKNHAYDYAVSLLGNLHFTSKVLYDVRPRTMDVETIINFSLTELDNIIRTHSNDKPILFQTEYFYPYIAKPNGSLKEYKFEMRQILTSLEQQTDRESEPKTSHFIDFLYEEIETKEPRIFLLESVIQSLIHAFEGSDNENNARHLLTLLYYMENLASKKTLSNKS